MVGWWIGRAAIDARPAFGNPGPRMICRSAPQPQRAPPQAAPKQHHAARPDLSWRHPKSLPADPP
jgi:hypothetical protein